MRLIPGPYTPADDLISALGHVDAALASLGKDPDRFSRWVQAGDSRLALLEAQTRLRKALEAEPSAAERAEAHGIPLDLLLGR